MTGTQTTDAAKASAALVHVREAKIILLSTVAAIAYGIVHDEITARLCVEYFTIAHPPLFHTSSPTILGICWGIAATFGVGVLLGFFLALVSQSGGVPPIPILHAFKSILGLVAVTALSASLAGVIGFELSRRSIICLPAGFAELIPSSQHHRFMAVWFAHCTSYLVGLGGGAFVIFRIWLERGKPRVLTFLPRTKGAIVRELILVAIGAWVVWFRFFKS